MRKINIQQLIWPFEISIRMAGLLVRVGGVTVTFAPDWVPDLVRAVNSLSAVSFMLREAFQAFLPAASIASAASMASMAFCRSAMARSRMSPLILSRSTDRRRPG